VSSSAEADDQLRSIRTAHLSSSTLTPAFQKAKKAARTANKRDEKKGAARDKRRSQVRRDRDAKDAASRSQVKRDAKGKARARKANK
jgi:hypothetical protein